MKVIITGATGMVGKGVLLECLETESVAAVLAVNRNSLDIAHPKLKQVLLEDFSQPETIKDNLSGYDACFYCMGISSFGLNEESYTLVTYDMTKSFATLLHELNPDMIFNYVSGSGTDSSEKGKIMWARVKGRTENMVLNMGFKDAYAFRPGLILPVKGVKSKTAWYNAFYVAARPLFPLLIRLNSVTTSAAVGQAMIASVLHPVNKKHLENRDINELALTLNPK
ncbi:MAG: NAD-dependent epimerase/dehydratase family protein [Fidelibacterota bacterium]